MSDKPTDDLRIGKAQPLITPWVLAEQLPLPRYAGAANYRRRPAAPSSGCSVARTHRVLAIVGPCSVHDPEALLEYAARLQGDAASPWPMP